MIFLKDLSALMKNAHEYLAIGDSTQIDFFNFLERHTQTRLQAIFWDNPPPLKKSHLLELLNAANKEPQGKEELIAILQSKLKELRDGDKESYSNSMPTFKKNK